MQPQPQPIDHIADMTPEDLRTHLRNAYANTTALSREVEMLHGMIRTQKAQRDALLAACKATQSVFDAGTYIVPFVRDGAKTKLESAIRQTESPGTITVYSLPTCDACGEGFTPAEWEKRHDGHEDGCPRQDDPDGDAVCECDLVYHERCCPDCRD